MATYFHGSSEIQANGDGLQTLILMNPTNTSYLGYSDTQHQQSQQQPQPPGNNFVFLNSSNTPGGSSSNFLHAPLSHTQQLVGIPLTSAASTSPQDHYFQHHLRQDVSPLHHAFFPRIQYNPYSQSLDVPMAREVPRTQQVLSLSLSSQQQNYGSFKTSSPLANISLASGDDVRVASSSSASGISNDVNGMQGVVLNSKYLKVAQELLDEVVNVDKGVKIRGDSAKGFNGVVKNVGEASSEKGSAAGDGQSVRESGGKSESELTTTERQEIQMKKAKLVNMLDEVEQRYRQYHHQIQIVVSWFEQAAGINSAKTYTALALQTISKQFRCLKDAILGQVRAANKRLGEEDSLGGKTGGSRLKFIDNQLRQQRALQQLGMIQHNAWRPQRGLPERSVSVLRAWLFEHFLHPYPKESDKLMLAKQTGLTRSQVSNWFINARVRLWKPMVEEMYTEEMKEQEKKVSEGKSGKSEANEDSSKPTASPEKSSSLGNQNRAYIQNQDHAFNPNNASPASTSPATSMNIQNQSGFNLIGSSEMETMTQGSPKKQRAAVMLHSPTSVPSIKMDENHDDLNEESLSMKFNTERHSREGFSLLGGPTNFIEGFGSYPIAELGRFGAEQFQSPYSGNGFSLTLGLPQCENLSMSVPHQPFLPNQNMPMGRGVEIGDTSEYGNINTSTSNHSTGVYENINMQNGKRFSAQLLPDFVA